MSQLGQANGIPAIVPADTDAAEIPANLVPASADIPVKSILKKSGNKEAVRKKSSHVNYAFEHDEERPPKKPKTATVIDKKTGKSRPLTLDNNKHGSENGSSKVVSVMVH